MEADMDYRKGFWIVTVVLLLVLLWLVRFFAINPVFFPRYRHGAINDPQNPQNVTVNKMARPDQIRSVADVKVLMTVITASWYDGLVYYNRDDRLAQAEFEAVRDPQERIPESVVASMFDRRIDEFELSPSLHISPEILHTYRLQTMALGFPGLVRLPDCSVPNSCRPLEAVLLLHELDQSAGGASGPGLPSDWESRTPEQRQFWAQSNMEKTLQLNAAIHTYFVRHPDYAAFADDALNQLGVG
jgi:hypothetical protein